MCGRHQRSGEDELTTRGMLLVAVTALLTVMANLLMRGGVLRAGGFSLSLSELRTEVWALARQPMFVGGFILYGLSAIVWFRVLATENLSTSYPMLISLTFVLVTLDAVLFFKESVSWVKVLGIVIILCGILLVARAGGKT